MEYLSVPGPLSVKFAGAPFNTNTFLHGFAANPEGGDIVVPHVVAGAINTSFVSDKRVGEVASMVNAVVEEARDLRANVAHEWDAHLPYALSATDGEWTMHPMQWHDYVSYDEGVVFTSRSGKHVSLWNYKYRPEIGVGFSGRYATAYQKIQVEKYRKDNKRICTSHYRMSFLGLGMQALARHLDIDMTDMDFHMSGVALKMANEIYFNGPYSSAQLMNPPQLRADGKDYQLIESSGGPWTFPREFTPYNVEFAIDLSHEDIPHVGGGIPVHVTLWRDRLLIDIHRRDDHPESLMPLTQPLAAIWEGARILAAVDPDDGGYLARIM